MLNIILFPSSYFSGAKVDEDLQEEYDAVISTGLFDVAIFSYDKWFNDEKLEVTGVPNEKRTAVYRGWMMKPDQYEKFYSKLLEKNIELITKPAAYRLMHIFPNIYEHVREDTAKMAVYPLHTKLDMEELKTNFTRFMVKDFVKSVKGTEFPRYFDESISQTDFDKWMEVFYKYRGDLLTGGICIKEYLDLKLYGSKSNEYRVFYINHEIATVSRNSGQANYTPLPPQELIDKYRNLDSPFYTIDYAELTDGSWKILEAGDGEVSGLSQNQDYKHFFRALHQCFKNV